MLGLVMLLKWSRGDVVAAACCVCCVDIHCWRLTEPVSVTSKPWARASQPMMVAISCTSCLVSLACVDWERRRLSFAFRHGWVETWTLDGSDEEEAMVAVGRVLLIVI